MAEKTKTKIINIIKIFVDNRRNTIKKKYPDVILYTDIPEKTQASNVYRIFPIS